jgi:hypothetical protein
MGSTVAQYIDEEDLADLPPLVDRKRWEDGSSDDESDCAPPLGTRRALEEEEVCEEDVELPPNMDSPFEWSVPDLAEVGTWFQARMRKLRTLSKGWKDREAVLMEGRRLLVSHRLNYTAQGSQRLEIMWWEWSPEHWEYLRFGSSMNFMNTPEPGLE